MNGKILKQPKSSSLHRQIIMAKGSSVWLDWQIAHLGSGIAFGAFSSSFKNQTIGFKSASQANLEVVAKRIGQNGTLTLQSSIPAPFSGRVEVISSNSTLVIHDLQYNDSLYQFSSNIALETSPSGTPIPPVIHLTPSIQLTIIGIYSLLSTSTFHFHFLIFQFLLFIFNLSNFHFQNLTFLFNIDCSAALFASGGK